MAPESFITYHRDEEALTIIGHLMDSHNKHQHTLNDISFKLQELEETVTTTVTTTVSGNENEVHVINSTGDGFKVSNPLVYTDSVTNALIVGYDSANPAQPGSDLKCRKVIALENVGIGEINPALKLHINSGSTNECARFESLGTEVTIELKDASGTASLKCSNDFRFNNSTNGEVVRITTDGKVGIGITEPEEDLEVAGNIQIDSANVARLKFQKSGNPATAHALGEIDGEEDGTNGGDLQFFTKVDGGSVTEKLRINNVGAVGIGGANFGTAGAVLTSNGSGAAVSWTPPVAFKATNAVGSVTGGFGATKFSNNLTDVTGGSRGSFQVGSSYNTSTGNFTAPYDGLYYFHASVLWDTSAFAATWCSVLIGLSTIIYSDDAFVIDQVGANEAFNTNFTQNCAGVVKLNEGQEVCVFTNGNSTSSEITLKFCVFGGYLIQRL